MRISKTQKIFLKLQKQSIINLEAIQGYIKMLKTHASDEATENLLREMIRDKKELQKAFMTEMTLIKSRIELFTYKVRIAKYINKKNIKDKNKFMKMFNYLNFDNIFALIKTIITQLTLFKDYLHFTDTYINKNHLLQNTYYKTITSRP